MTKITQTAAAIALALAATVSTTAAANLQPDQSLQPTFTYTAIAVHQVDLDGEKMNGFGIDFGFDVTEKVFAEVQYFDVGDTYGEYIGGTYYEADLQAQQLYANLGYKIYHQGNTAVYVSGGLAYGKASYTITGFGSESMDDNGFNVQMGVRSRLTQQFEIDANVRHYDMGDGVNDEELAITGRYYLDDELSLLFGYTAAGDDVSYSRVGVSWSF